MSRGEDVNGYESEISDCDEDHERHKDLGREPYALKAKSPHLAHDLLLPDLQRQSNDNDTLECQLEHLSIGRRTYKHSEYRLKVTVKNRQYSLHIQDFNDGKPIKHGFPRTAFKAFQVS